jgi:2'-hydroxyisoflavone reductase
MRILVLGGTGFVGRHVVAEALGHGHDVTLFNRGRTNPELFPGARRLIGDRATAELSALKTGEWDGVIDVSGRRPEHVKATADLLHGRVATYCFISTVAVYATQMALPTDEDCRLLVDHAAASRATAGLMYGARKAACEWLIRSKYPDYNLILRPGIVVGPHDPTDRFNHWVSRMARGGAVLGPARPDQPVQMIHAEDLASFAFELLERREPGVFNCVGPDVPSSFEDMLNSCRAASDSPCEIVWAPERLLHTHGISLPFSLPESGQRDGVFLRSNARAKAHGLRNRSTEECARSTLTWITRHIQGGTLNAPLPPNEAELLSVLVNNATT